MSFIPERFDPSSPHYLTPEGKARHPFAFCPFSGGHRICVLVVLPEVHVKFHVQY